MTPAMTNRWMLKLSTTKKCERLYSSSSDVGGGWGAGRSSGELLVVTSAISEDVAEDTVDAGLRAAADECDALGLLLLAVGELGMERAS